MKNHPIPRSQKGSVLVTTLVFVVVLSTVAAAVLSVASHEYLMSKRSLSWNQSLFSAEAGIEIGWNEMNKLTSLNTNGTFMSGWTYLGANQWTLSNQNLTPLAGVDSASTFVVNVTTNTPQTGYAKIVASGTMSSPVMSHDVTRNVEINIAPVKPWSMAILTKGLIDFNGNTAIVDSYNSSNSTYSTATRRAHGNIGTNGNLIDAAGLDIYGGAMTGPGGVVTTAPGFNMYQPGAGDSGTNYVSDGLKVSIPDVKLPWTPTANMTPPTVAGKPTLTAGTHSDVSLATINSDLVITGTGTIRIYVNGSIDLAGSDDITITPNPAGSTLKVEFYVKDSVSLLGNGIINPTSKPTDLSIYGLPTCSTVTVGGTADLIGALYTPNADATINGGAKIYGAMVASTARLVGTVDFHYDEALANSGNLLYYTMALWREY